jgi:hypothetical protein
VEVRRWSGGLRCRTVTGGSGSITTGYATAGGVTNAWVLCELVNATCAGPRYAMLGEELLQLTVLFGEGVFVSCDTAEVLLQSQDFLFKSFDVQLLSFSMCPI